MSARSMFESVSHPLNLLSAEMEFFKTRASRRTAAEITHYIVRVGRKSKRDRVAVELTVGRNAWVRTDVLIMNLVKLRHRVGCSVGKRVAIQSFNRSAVGGDIIDNRLVSLSF